MTIFPWAGRPAWWRCAGAEAFLVTRADIAADLGLETVRILSTIERHNAFASDPVQETGGWALDMDEFWDMAGIEPDAVDFLQTYDDYPVISMMQIEAPEFVRRNDLEITGSFPNNTSGGQLSVGQAGAAGGFLGLVEGLRQLTGTAGATQVKGAGYGVVSGFGMINYDRGVCTAAAALTGATA